MKKLFLLLTVFCLMLIVGVSTGFADWSVTTTWTVSVGPGLEYEEVLLDGVIQCNVIPPAPTSCNFVVTALSGQEVIVRSFNTQGAYADTSPVILAATPAPATGVVVTITYVP